MPKWKLLSFIPAQLVFVDCEFSCRSMKKFSLLSSYQKGFTLIEMLTVISIFGVVSAIIISILFVGLRGARKSELLNIIRQNGNIAVSQVQRNVRFASTLNSPTTCVPSVSIPV